MRLNPRIVPDNTADCFRGGESGRLPPCPRVADLTGFPSERASGSAEDPRGLAPADIPGMPPGACPRRPATLSGLRNALRQTQTA